MGYDETTETKTHESVDDVVVYLGISGDCSDNKQNSSSKRRRPPSTSRIECASDHRAMFKQNQYHFWCISVICKDLLLNQDQATMHYSLREESCSPEAMTGLKLL
jgi:hypothetical protein